MAVVTGEIVNPAIATNPGVVAVYQFQPITVGAVRVPGEVISTLEIDRPFMNSGRSRRIIDSAIVNNHKVGYWDEKTHLLTGEELTGYVETPTYQLGNVITQQTRKFTVYNARSKTPVDITSISISNSEGVTIDDASQPDFLNNLSSKEYTITISEEGPPVISVVFTIVTTGGETLTVTFLGSRTIVMPFVPQLPTSEGLEYKTWVSRSKDGREQRQSLRNRGIQTLEYTYLLDNRYSSSLENYMYQRADSVFGVPYWIGSTELSADAATGALTIDLVNATDRGFREGDGEALALIWRDEFTFESVQIDSISGNQLTLNQATLNDWVAGDIVIPLRRAYAGVPNQKPFMVNYREFKIVYDVIANSDDDASTAVFSSTYDSLPVFDQDLLQNGIQYDRKFDIAQEPLDPITGPRSPKTWLRSPQLTTGFFREFTTLTEFFAFVKFFKSMQGRRSPFWLSTHITDFEIQVDQLAGTILQVKNVYFNDAFSNDDSLRRKVLEITYVDGSIDYRTITAVSVTSDAQEDLTLNSASSQDLTAANVRRISWLQKVRFGNDRLQFVHNEGGQTTVTVSVVDLDE